MYTNILIGDKKFVYIRRILSAFKHSISRVWVYIIAPKIIDLRAILKNS